MHSFIQPCYTITLKTAQPSGLNFLICSDLILNDLPQHTSFHIIKPGVGIKYDYPQYIKGFEFLYVAQT